MVALGVVALEEDPEAELLRPLLLHSPRLCSPELLLSASHSTGLRRLQLPALIPQALIPLVSQILSVLRLFHLLGHLPVVWDYQVRLLLLTCNPAHVRYLGTTGAAAPGIVLTPGRQLAILAAAVGAPILHNVARVL